MITSPRTALGVILLIILSFLQMGVIIVVVGLTYHTLDTMERSIAHRTKQMEILRTISSDNNRILRRLESHLPPDPKPNLTPD